MQIPVSLPDPTTLPPSVRRDTQAATPVTPLSSVGGTTEAPDPRLTLQWAQPVTGQRASDPARTVPERVAPSAVLHARDNADGMSPDVSPSVQWSESGRALSQLLRTSTQHMGEDGNVVWPSPPNDDSGQGLPPTQQVLHFMQRLYLGLMQSDVFAAQHLSQAWQRIKPKAPDASTDSASSAVEEPPYQRWLDALAPDSPAAEQATHMLVSGKMQWLGDILPGLSLRIQREDAWREDPHHPGQMQKGASLKVEMDLPHSGTLCVLASQWADHLDVRVKLPKAASTAWESAWPELQTRMSALQRMDLHLSMESAA